MQSLAAADHRDDADADALGRTIACMFWRHEDEEGGGGRGAAGDAPPPPLLGDLRAIAGGGGGGSGQSISLHNLGMVRVSSA